MAAPSYITGSVPSADDFNQWMVNGLYVRKTAAESVTSSTAMQNDDQLSLPVPINNTYLVDAFLITGGAQAAGIKEQWIVPAGADLKLGVVGITVGASTAASVRYDYTIASSALGHGLLSDVTGAFTTIQVRGTLLMGGTSGTFSLQWAQSTSNSTATTVNVGSYLRLIRVE